MRNWQNKNISITTFISGTSSRHTTSYMAEKIDMFTKQFRPDDKNGGYSKDDMFGLLKGLPCGCFS